MLGCRVLSSDFTALHEQALLIELFIMSCTRICGYIAARAFPVSPTGSYTGPNPSFKLLSPISKRSLMFLATSYPSDVSHALRSLSVDL